MENKKILVHMCCAPCATSSVEKLMLENYEVTMFFSNDNIFPVEEHDKRLEYARKLAKIYEVVLEEDLYNYEEWREKVKGLEDEPEQGKRCIVCMEHRMEKTNIAAKTLGFDAWTTTLTLSPYKVSKMVFDIGKNYPKYIPFDFKKEDGFLKSLKLCKEYDIYMQNYCGCEFSLQDKIQREKIKRTNYEYIPRIKTKNDYSSAE